MSDNIEIVAGVGDLISAIAKGMTDEELDDLRQKLRTYYSSMPVRTVDDLTVKNSIACYAYNKICSLIFP